jgi:hypothetical protein
MGNDRRRISSRRRVLVHPLSLAGAELAVKFTR